MIKEKLEKMTDGVRMKGHIISLTTYTAANIIKAISDWPGVDCIGCAAYVMERSVQKYVPDGAEGYDRHLQQGSHTHPRLDYLPGTSEKSPEGKRFFISLSCKTRWWSYYNMLTTLLEYRYEVISTMEVANKRPNGPHTVIEDSDWDNAKSMCDVLEPFAQAVELIERDKYITFSFTPLLVNGLNAAILQAASSATDQDGAASLGGEALFDDHIDRWEELTDATKVAAMMDPRTKDGLWMQAAERDAYFGRVREKFKELIERDIAAEQAQAATAQVSGEAPTGAAASSHGADS
ncbi:unnamed protein product, partial [Discosporangium mesarthrocarpum]